MAVTLSQKTHTKREPMLRPFAFLTMCLLFVASNNVPWALADTTDVLIPQNLLGLVHAPEVQTELELSDDQQQKLEALFEKLDGEWFRARVLPLEQQRSTIAKLEKQVLQWFEKNVTSDQFKRLKQLELQSLGMRLLLRPEVTRDLELDSGQQARLIAFAKEVNVATLQLQQATMKNEATQKHRNDLTTAVEAEQQALQSVLKPPQQMKLSKLIGKPFDTAQLKRIYPMAPELVAVDEWINSNPITLKELRGKVVILHYYAFQCHNCHANFEHYNTWHKQFPSDQVVVIGIQRPETSAERDPAAIRAAAKERNMKYPILIDLESKNWDAWANTMWPTVYVIDQQGYIRHWWQGELNWQGVTGDKTISDLVTSLIKES